MSMTDAVRSRIRNAGELPDKAAARILFELALEHDADEDGPDPSSEDVAPDESTFETLLDSLVTPDVHGKEFTEPDKE